jgi:hypothetical protein
MQVTLIISATEHAQDSGDAFGGGKGCRGPIGSSQEAAGACMHACVCRSMLAKKIVKQVLARTRARMYEHDSKNP